MDFSGGTDENTKNLSEVSQCAGPDLNLGPLECQTRVLITCSRLLVCTSPSIYRLFFIYTINNSSVFK